VNEGKRILIVDDEPLVLNAISRVLQEKGFSVRAANNGEEGLAEAKRFFPDLVLTDVRMPVMDGWDFIRHLRSSPEFTLVPVVVLTDTDSFDRRIQGFRLGADDFVGKGTVVNELEVRIVRALDRSNAISEALNGARKAISWAREALDEALTQAIPVGLSHPAGGNPPPQQGAAPGPSNRRQATISELSTMSQQPQTALSADSPLERDEFTVSVGAQPAAASSSGGPIISTDKFSMLDTAAVVPTDDSTDIASLAKSSQGLPGNWIAAPSFEAPEQDAAAGANPQDDEGLPGMRGSLSQIGLATILTLLAGGEKTGILTLSHPDGGTGRILMRSGSILKIKIDGKPEMDPVGAVSELIKWKEAAFVFKMIDVTAADEVKIPVQHLLMEAARIFDEA
jgi:CheY-like chemotaxis protein